MERMLRSRICAFPQARSMNSGFLTLSYFSARRVLAEQHIALSDALDDPFHFFNEPVPAASGSAASPGGDGEHIGIIYTNLKVSSVVNKGIHLLRRMFEHEVESGQRTGDAAVIPDVVVDGALEARFACIPEHLEYIIFELLKNSMMAVMRRPLAMRDTICGLALASVPSSTDIWLTSVCTPRYPRHHCGRAMLHVGARC